MTIIGRNRNKLAAAVVEQMDAIYLNRPVDGVRQPVAVEGYEASDWAADAIRVATTAVANILATEDDRDAHGHNQLRGDVEMVLMTDGPLGDGATSVITEDEAKRAIDLFPTVYRAYISGLIRSTRSNADTVLAAIEQLGGEDTETGERQEIIDEVVAAEIAAIEDDRAANLNYMGLTAETIDQREVTERLQQAHDRLDAYLTAANGYTLGDYSAAMREIDERLNAYRSQSV